MNKLLILFAALSLSLVPQTKSSNHEVPANDQHLLEIGRAPSLRAADEDIKAIKIVSYNIRFRSGEDLKKLIQFLKNDPEVGGASIIGLQEVDRNRKRTGNTNTVKMLAEELGMHYAWAAPPSPKPHQEEETGVALLSVYPLSEVSRIVLPHAGPNKRRRVGLGATVKIGGSRLRVYSMHSETRIAEDKKLAQMKAAIDDLAHYPKEMPAIVMGDLNTWEPGVGSKTRKLFTGEGFQTPFDGESTFCQRILMVDIKMKLDWVWLRNLESTNSGIDKKISLSDHWPLWVGLKLKRG
ncbi:MAG TPA: endonuclease/exonuclease/phosphatase family protein [Pyrinomonadaceae bacterium]|nr:endonuclease/exonuclease/phosphatase family protein [Pyrinomonadaceae bacterium]